jgi:hypothetical protein
MVCLPTRAAWARAGSRPIPGATMAMAAYDLVQLLAPSPG